MTKVHEKLHTAGFRAAIGLFLCIHIGCQTQSSSESVQETAKPLAKNRAPYEVMTQLAKRGFKERDGTTPIVVDSPVNSDAASKQAFKMLGDAAVQCRVDTGDGKNYVAYKEDGHAVNDVFLKGFEAECRPLLPWLTEKHFQTAVAEALVELEKERIKPSIFNVGSSKKFTTGPTEVTLELSEQFEEDEFGDANATATIMWRWVDAAPIAE
jgi:hypothetical protein